MQTLLNKISFFVLFSALITACGTTKKMSDQSTIVDQPIIKETILDEMVVTAPPIEKVYSLPVYNPSATRNFDLLHTKLNLKFDWANQYVIGQAEIETTPLFYSQDQLMLDAVGFDIKEIKINGRKASYDYDGYDIDIALDRLYKRGEKITVFIDYVAKPNEAPEGGSAAITSDKGLFFINPLGEEDKPMQIWTQGETESNSKWFPTFDKPNERCTQEITLTVKDEFETLSNGLRVSSIKNADGTRTDTWKQDKPHAPYLFMVAVGDFAEIQDTWRNKPLTYMVEHDYAPYAKDIFAHTPEMLSFFSDKFNYEYPWAKYSQIITRDYVSGAMENTTAVIFGEFVQKTDRELIDNDNDYIVAHEMMHHWFGDLVTCESWANLTLNEGFANYSEYLWAEHHDGVKAADWHRINELRGYLGSASQQGVHPLIHFGYNDKEEMFDAHSYNKGGLILHMLRNIIGDDAYFTACNKYLKDNEYTAVEADELRMAMEDVTGLDLNWFWNQWFFSAGHPEINASHVYDTNKKTLTIQVEQIHEGTDEIPGIFILPMNVALYDANGNLSTYEISIEDRAQNIILEEVDFEPSAVILDANASTLAIINHEKTQDELIAQAMYSDKLLHVYNAVNKITDSASFAKLEDRMLNYDHQSIRNKAIKEINTSKPGITSKLSDMAINDKHTSVRTAAIKALSSVEDFDMEPIVAQIMKNEKSYPVLGAAVSALYNSNPDQALIYTTELQNEKTDMLIGPIGEIYGKSGDAKYLPFFEEKLNTVGLYNMFDFYGKYFDMLKKQDVPTIVNGAKNLGNIAGNISNNLYRKFVAMNTLNRIKTELGNKSGAELTPIVTNAITTINEIMTDIKQRETNEMLTQRYQAF